MYVFKLDPWYWGEWAYSAHEYQIKNNGVYPKEVHITFTSDNKYTFKIEGEEYSGEYEYYSERGDNVREVGYFIFNNNPEEYQKMHVIPDWGTPYESLYWSDYKNDYMWVENYYVNPIDTKFWFDDFDYKSKPSLYNVGKYEKIFNAI